MSLFDPGALDDLIHTRARLAIMAFLTTVGSADFGSVRRAIGISDGNLSQHLKKLEEAGHLRLEKTVSPPDFGGPVRKRTQVALTEEGRKVFYDYLDHLHSLLSKIPERRN